MKRTLWAVLAALLLVGMLGGCGGNSGSATDENLGKYVCTKVSLGDIEMDISEMDMGETYIELKEKGKAVITIDNESVSGEYKINGQQLHLTVDGETMIPSIADGEIRLDLEGMEFIFVKGA